MSDDQAPDDDLDLPDGAVETARITIVKVFDDNAPGGIGIYTQYSEGLTLVDALGLLSFVQTIAPIDFGLLPMREEE